MYTYFVFTVFYYLFGRTERLPTQGGRGRVLSPEQETEIMNMVLENNSITLRQIQFFFIENNDMFQNKLINTGPCLAQKSSQDEAGLQGAI